RAGLPARPAHGHRHRSVSEGRIRPLAALTGDCRFLPPRKPIEQYDDAEERDHAEWNDEVRGRHRFFSASKRVSIQSSVHPAIPPSANRSENGGSVSNWPRNVKAATRLATSGIFSMRTSRCLRFNRSIVADDGSQT